MLHFLCGGGMISCFGEQWREFESQLLIRLDLDRAAEHCDCFRGMAIRGKAVGISRQGFQIIGFQLKGFLKMRLASTNRFLAARALARLRWAGWL